MLRTTALLCIAALSSGAATRADAATQPKPKAQLHTALTLKHALTNGVAISPDGRTFAVIAKLKGQSVPQIAEYVDGALRPYPNAAWNAWKPGDDASRAFVHANSIRFGPDGTLWVVDVGASQGGPTLPHGPKLVGIDTATGIVKTTVYFDTITRAKSFLDDVRFDGRYAFLSDAGSPGLIVYDMQMKTMWRVLDRTPPVTENRPLMADGRPAIDEHGKPAKLHADQIEVSPDGKTLYFQPGSGPLSAIEAKYLTDRTLSDAARLTHVRLIANTQSTGGTAIDAAGNIYVSETNDNRVIRVTPSGKITTVVHDPSLLWGDAMWITADGLLWMPASQLERTPHFDAGKTAVVFPDYVYTTSIGVGPPKSDHR